MGWPNTGRNIATLAVAAALLALSATRAACEHSKFTPATVQVINAQRFVNETSGATYPVGSDLVFTLRASAEAKRLAERGFQIRIFPLGPTDSRPNPWALFDPCYVFFSLVVPDGRVNRDGRIDLFNINGLDFLTVTHGRPPSKGRFWVVFENKSDHDSVFRLNKQNMSEYFARGLYIEITPPSNKFDIGDINQQADRILAATAEIDRAAHQNDPDHRCYQYRLEQAKGEDGEQLAYLDKCGPASAAGSPQVNP